MRFHPIVLEREVDRVQELDVYKVWYNDAELELFRKKSSSKDPKSSSRDARVFNHIRRVLLHQEVYKQMGSEDQIVLSAISRELSKPARNKARKSADHIAKEVESYQYSSPNGGCGLLPNQVVELYDAYVFDWFSKNAACIPGQFYV